MKHDRFRLALTVVVVAVILCAPLAATKLVEVAPVDEQVIMVRFVDGEILYRDDGTGPRAFSGHDFDPGDDRLVTFGEALDVEAASRPASWTLVSDNDERFGDPGPPIR